MRYWVYINDQVSQEPYEVQDLFKVPGFTDETLIMPEDNSQQDWLAAYNYSDVQQAGAQLSSAPPEDTSTTEVYQEVTDRSVIPTHYQDIPADKLTKKKDLETTLLIKIDELTKEIRKLKERVNTLGGEITNFTVAPAPQPAATLHEYKPEPVLPKPVKTEETVDLDVISAGSNLAQSDNFLQDVVEADNSARQTLAAMSARKEDSETPPAEIMDLKANTLFNVPVSAVAPKPDIVENIKEDPLPYREELQAEELQAEPYAGQSSLSEKPAQPEPVPQEPEPLPQEQPAQEEPAPPAEEPAARVLAAPEETARAAVAPNAEEESVLKEFAQDKTPAAPEAGEKENLFIIENTPEEKPAESLEELTGRTPIAQEPQPAKLQNAQTLEDDKFLKTFTTGIEEVFMDQPTSIISDYVPPAVAEGSPMAQQQQQQQPAADAPEGAPPPAEQAAAPAEGLIDLKSGSAPKQGAGRVQNTQQTVQSVRRIKPAAIKTVPMVTGDGQDIQNMDYGLDSQVEEVQIEAEAEGSPFFKFVKMLSGLIVLLVIILMFVMLLAWMDIIPKEYSPLHSVIGKFTNKPAAAQAPAKQEPSAAKAAAEAAARERAETAQQVIQNVRNYLLLDGMTLEEKIDALHSAAQVQWTADQSVEPDYYSVAVMLPPNKEGYTQTYRFSYNLQTRTLMPTTSEANTLMSTRITPAPLP